MRGVMGVRLRYAGAAGVLAMGVCLAPGQEASAQITRFGFDFDGRILVPVLVDGAGPLRVILDSGLGNGLLILNHAETGTELGLEYARTIPAVRGAGSGENKNLHLTTGNELSVPGLALGKKPVGVVDESRSVSGIPNVGVTGGLLLFDYTVEIDFDASEVRVYDPDGFQPPGGWVEVPLDFARNLPLLETTLRLPDGTDIPVRLIVDTGGKPPLGLRIENDRGLVPPPDAPRVLTGTGFRGDVFGRLGRVADVKVASFGLRDVVAAFADGEDAPILEQVGADGVLGIGALYRFNLIFDFGRRRLLLKPNRYASDRFEWNMAGLTIQADPAGNTVVYHVDQGSEAEARGLVKGDVVESVNGRAPKDYTYLELRKVFEEDGASVEMSVRRGDDVRAIRLALRSII